MHTPNYFFVWDPGTKNFNCMSEENVPLYHIDMIDVIDKFASHQKDAAVEMIEGLQTFITSLPGEDSSGVALLEGPFPLPLAGIKFTAWKFKFQSKEHSPLNKILNDLGINESKS